MMRHAALVVLCLAGAIPAVPAQDFGLIMDPTSGLALFRFESTPAGADIVVSGKTAGITDQTFRIDPDYLSSIQIVMDGFMPCGYEDGIKRKAKIGLTGMGIVLVCKLRRDTARAAPPDDRPSTWIMVEEGPSERGE